jgi:hypothetical protein
MPTHAAAVWRWLSRRPFVTSGPRGLSIHDLARDVLDAEFERRAPERYRAFHRIVHDQAVLGLRAATGLDRQLIAQQFVFLHRKSPLTSAFFTLRAQGSAAVVPARPDEYDEMCAIIERFEGPTSAELARTWFTEQPDQLSVVRGGDGVAALTHHVLCPTGSPMEDRDPVVRAVLAHVARHGPLRPGERVDIARFLAGAREHQRDPYAVLTGSVSCAIEWLARPLAWSVAVAVDTDFWAPYFDYLALAPLVEVDVGGCDTSRTASTGGGSRSTRGST